MAVANLISAPCNSHFDIDKIMQETEDPQLNPVLSWAELPQARPVIRELVELHKTSKLCQDMTFQDCIEDLYAIKAPKKSFGIASEMFSEGVKTALKIRQYLETHQDQQVSITQQQPPPRSHPPPDGQQVSITQQQPPPRSHDSHPPPEGSSLAHSCGESGRDRGDSAGEAASSFVIPPLPPDWMKRKISAAIGYTHEDLWNYCVHVCMRTKTAVKRRDLLNGFILSGAPPGVIVLRPTIDKWFNSTDRMRFSPAQVYAAAGIEGPWEKDCHRKVVVLKQVKKPRTPKRRRDDSSESDSSLEDGGKRRQRSGGGGATKERRLEALPASGGGDNTGGGLAAQAPPAPAARAAAGGGAEAHAAARPAAADALATLTEDAAAAASDSAGSAHRKGASPNPPPPAPLPSSPARPRRDLCRSRQPS